MKIVFDMIVYF